LILLIIYEMMKKIFEKIERLICEYNDLDFDKHVIDYNKYKLYSIVTSSTQLEGSTLDELDTKLLLEDGITAKGKPLEHHLMVKDNYNAIRFVLEQANKKILLTPEFLRQCNGLNMANTGLVVNSVFGTVDGGKGEYRKSSAMSEALGYYMEFSKIPDLVEQFCREINKQITNNSTIIEHLTTSFDAHANLVLIHPWMDGNKRTSRLIMNFIQQRAELPLSKVHKEDSREYLLALKNVKDNNTLDTFRKFMFEQFAKTLSCEISDYKKARKKKFSLIL
jgi:Fic family protein